MTSGWKTGQRAAELITNRLVILLVLLLALWGVYWLVAYRLAESALERSGETLAGNGGTVTCSESGVRGFPLSVRAACRLFRLDYQEGRYTTLGGAEAYVQLLRPWEFTANLTSPFALVLPREPEPVTAAWSQAIANARVSFGGLSSVDASLRDLRFEAFDVPSLTFHVADLKVTPSGNDYRLDLDLDGKIKSEVTSVMLPLAAAADFTAMGLGPALGNDPLAKVADWLRSGGDLRVDRGSVTIDQTIATLAGDLSLSPQGLLSGDVTVTVAGLDSFPQTAEVILTGLGAPANQLVTLIKGLGRRTTKDGAEAYELPLRFRNGLVSLGIIPIGQVPPVPL